MLLICRVRRARRLCLAILLVLVPGAGLLGVAQAGLPFPTHAPLSRSGSGAQNSAPAWATASSSAPTSISCRATASMSSTCSGMASA